MAVDGPLGPERAIKRGIGVFARLAQSPIRASTIAVCGHFALDTWDRRCMPVPDGRISIRVTEPVGPFGDEAEMKNTLQDRIRTTYSDCRFPPARYACAWARLCTGPWQWGRLSIGPG